jgi:hypothetical protein
LQHSIIQTIAYLSANTGASFHGCIKRCSSLIFEPTCAIAAHMQTPVCNPNFWDFLASLLQNRRCVNETLKRCVLASNCVDWCVVGYVAALTGRRRLRKCPRKNIKKIKLREIFINSIGISKLGSKPSTTNPLQLVALRTGLTEAES